MTAWPIAEFIMEELINKDWTWDEAFTAYKNELVFNDHSEDAIKVRLIVLNAFANLAKQKESCLPMFQN